MTLRVPRLKPGYDLRSLPLKPVEAFLLSRIDGVLTDRELSLVTGMSYSDTVEVLRKLHGFGAILLDEQPSSPPPSRGSADAARRAAAPEGERPLPPGGEPVALGRDVRHPADSPPLYDPAELDEPVELPPDRKRRILDLYYRLDDLSYYELLGVSDQADKKQIKSAYYRLAPEFHPDSYFRKQLGSYKQKIEAIFTRLTLAHDTLTSKQRRAEYDAYLEQTHKNRAMAALIEQTPRDIATVTSAVDASVRAAVAEPRDTVASPGRYSSERPPNEARAHAPAEQAVAPSQGAAAAPRSPHDSSAPGAGKAPQHGGSSPVAGGAPQPPPSRPAGAGAPVVPAASARDRREALARKLTAGLRRPPMSAPASAPAPTPPAAAAPTAGAEPRGPSSVRSSDATRAVEALKARYDSARSEAVRVQIARYSEAGRIAFQRKDYASAANAYRIAASLAPEDAELQKASAEMQRLAAAALADGYLKQADYEAQNGRWAEAALSYAKVCSGRPDDAAAHERVAFSTLQAGENTRRAVEFARRAVELAPTSVEYRLTLSLAYAAAGLEKSAAGELDRAAELAGNDGRLRALVAQAREQARKMGKQV